MQRLMLLVQKVIVFLLLGFLAGCTPERGSVPTVLETASTSPATATLLPALTPTSLQSQTVLPSPTMLLSSTPVPTLSATEKEAYLIDFVATNRGCELPCWWGIQPGITDWQKVLDLLAQLGWQGIYPPMSNVSTVHDFPLTDESHVPYLVLRFVEEKGNVHSVIVLADVSDKASNRVAYEITQQYSLNNVLSQYGKPSQVLVGLRSARTEPNAPFLYNLWLFYDSLGALIYYEGLAIQGEMIRVCPQHEDTWTINLYLQSPNFDLPLEKLVDLNFATELSQGYLRPLDEATSLSIEAFYRTFVVSNGQACFESPAGMWP